MKCSFCDEILSYDFCANDKDIGKYMKGPQRLRNFQRLNKCKFNTSNLTGSVNYIRIIKHSEENDLKRNTVSQSSILNSSLQQSSFLKSSFMLKSNMSQKPDLNETSK